MLSINVAPDANAHSVPCVLKVRHQTRMSASVLSGPGIGASLSVPLSTQADLPELKYGKKKF